MSLNPFPVTDLRPELELMHLLRMRRYYCHAWNRLRVCVKNKLVSFGQICQFCPKMQCTQTHLSGGLCPHPLGSCTFTQTRSCIWKREGMAGKRARRTETRMGSDRRMNRGRMKRGSKAKGKGGRERKGEGRESCTICPNLWTLIITTPLAINNDNCSCLGYLLFSAHDSLYVADCVSVFMYKHLVFLHSSNVYIQRSI